MKPPKVKTQHLRRAAVWHQGIMETLRVAAVATTRGQALACFRKRPVITIEEARDDLLTTQTAAQIRHFSSLCEVYGRKHQNDPFMYKPIPSPFEWQLMEDVTFTISEARGKGRKVSDQDAIKGLKLSHRARYKNGTVEALRQRLMRARRKQKLWEAYAIRNWTAARLLAMDSDDAALAS